jgi:3-methylcrotonyl-CoA carboxylase alpha subunit
VFDSVLIANRGEIACRIIKTARRLGLRTIAVYSDVDRCSLHVALADEAYAIGPAPALSSYLDGQKILSVAQQAGAQCLHPGYGFLAENAQFAGACREASIVFVGPPADAIRAMGLKDLAKSLMQKAGVPVVPGYHGSRQEPNFLREKAYEIGYPLVIKAVAGGGGRGMRKVDTHAEFEAALESAQREARASFGNGQVLIEKYIAAPRHVEMQIFADSFGDVVHLFERDCSLQRRHQKVVEEAPAPGMSSEVRDTMGRAAIAAAKAVQYVGAGTVEFIADSRHGLRSDGFYFMEMNTRLQVEHPVTEAITGLDLIEMQFRVAAGEPLGVKQSGVAVAGHAVEARLYAEDPESGFLPSSGEIYGLRLPQGEGVRVDSGVREGDSISPHYDPLMAKIIAYGSDRAQALDRLQAALEQTIVVGPKTNAAFLEALLGAPEFRAERFDTGFIAAHLAKLGALRAPLDPIAIAAGVSTLLSQPADSQHLDDRNRHARDFDDPWSHPDAFEFAGVRRTKLPILVEDERLTAVLIGGTEPAPGIAALNIELPALGYDGSAAAPICRQIDHYDRSLNSLVMLVAGEALVLRNGRQTRLRLVDFDDFRHAQDDASDGSVRAPMHGKLVQLFVAAGDRVEKGARVAIVEAMKMEHTLLAPIAGTIAEIAVQPGTQVEKAAILVMVAPASA